MKLTDNVEQVKGIVRIYSNNKLVYEDHNLICDGIKEMFTAYLSGDAKMTTTHIYGQHNNTYVEGGGPYFTPSKTDTVSSLAEPVVKSPIIYKPVTGNVLTNIAIFSGYTGEIFFGAGLICSTPTSELLIARVAFPGILARSSHDLLIAWDIVFDN